MQRLGSQKKLPASWPTGPHSTKMEQLIGPQSNLAHREGVNLFGSRWTRNLEEAVGREQPLKLTMATYTEPDLGRGVPSPSTLAPTAAPTLTPILKG